MSVLFVLNIDPPGNLQFAASNVTVCKDEVINFTCSVDGNPAVHTYQLFENESLVSNGSNSDGMWSRTMSTGGVFVYKCVAINSVGTQQSENVTVTVNGKQNSLYANVDAILIINKTRESTSMRFTSSGYHQSHHSMFSELNTFFFHFTCEMTSQAKSK